MIEVKIVKYYSYRYCTPTTSLIAALDPTSILVVGLFREESYNDPIRNGCYNILPTFLYKINTFASNPVRISNHTFTVHTHTQVNFPHLFPTHASHYHPFFITYQPFLLAHPAVIQSSDCSNSTPCTFLYSLMGTVPIPFIHSFIYSFTPLPIFPFIHSFDPPPRPFIPPPSLLPLPSFILTVLPTLIFPH